MRDDKDLERYGSIRSVIWKKRYQAEIELPAGSASRNFFHNHSEIEPETVTDGPVYGAGSCGDNTFVRKDFTNVENHETYRNV